MRHKRFLPPSLPLVTALVDWLETQVRTDAATGVKSLDHLLVAVPTGEAGRRLRLALAKRLQAVVPPRLLPPNALLDALQGPKAPALPTQAELSALLAHVLMETTEGELLDLLPLKARPTEESAPGTPAPQHLTFSWGVNTGAELISVWEELRKNALSVQNVADRAASGVFPSPEAPLPEKEVARWSDFAILEKRLLGKLHEHGLVHPNEARKRVVQNPVAPDGIDGIVLPALLDAPPALYPALERLADNGLAVHVLVHANEDASGSFDDWGRPLPGPLPRTLPLADSQIHRSPDSRHQAEDVASAYAAMPGDSTVLAMLDSELLPAMESAFLSHGIAVHNAAESLLRETSLGRVLDLIWSLLQPDATCVPFVRFLREADVRACLGASGLFVAPALKEFDDVQTQHLPRTLADLRRFAQEDGAECLCAVQEKLDGLLTPPAGTAPRSTDHLLAVLRRLFQNRHLQENIPADRDFASAASAVREAVRDCSTPLLDTLLDERERAVLVRALLFNATYSLEAAEESKPLLGWLELPWCEESRLILAGFNEGCVPEAIVGDAFLPDPLRRALGLGSNDERLARDAALFFGLLASRHPGDVQVFLEKQNDRGDVKKPSRLLFLCPDDILPRRAGILFRDPEVLPTGGTPTVPESWRLALPFPDERPITQLGVTSFSTYLANPFLFYLQKTLGEESVEAEGALEISAKDFGTLCHAALQKFAEDKVIRESEDPDDILAFLKERIHEDVQQTFGSPDHGLSAILRLQEEAAFDRMAFFARKQADLHREGWRIVSAEQSLNMDIDGMAIRGQIDRIDRNETTGQYRILDYKTWASSGKTDSYSKTSVPPAFQTLEDSISVPSFQKGKGAASYWHDLQLPLYHLLVRTNAAACGIPADAPMEFAYFVLADTEEETKITALDITQDALGAAFATARLVVRAIQCGTYPHKTANLPEPYGALFPVNIAEGLSDAWLKDQHERLQRFLAGH